MSLRQPSTAPPVGVDGTALDRYSGYQDIECPECGSIGIDVWIDDGAVSCRGVCVDSGCKLSKDELLRISEESA